MNSSPSCVGPVGLVESPTTFSTHIGPETHELSESTDAYCVSSTDFGFAEWFQASLLAECILAALATCAASEQPMAAVFSLNWDFPLGTAAGTGESGFTGKPYSSATGLFYYLQRWYDPEIVRFMGQRRNTGSSI